MNYCKSQEISKKKIKNEKLEYFKNIEKIFFAKFI